MPRGRKKILRIRRSLSRNYVKYSTQIKISESYFSLFLGALVILVASLLVFTFAKNRTYDKINTSVSIHQELSVPTQNNSIQNLSTPKSYEVKTGDSLWKIAEKVYGSGYNWVDLAKANNLSNPGLIYTGNKLIVPVVQKITVATVLQAQNNGPSISGSNYTIVEGDNLWNIAVRAYGDGYKWPEITKANKIDNSDLIFPDNILKLPR